MKALFEHVGLDNHKSIKAKKYRVDTLDVPYHFHPELELTWIISSTGKVFVNNAMVDYEPGDAFVFGSDVPHIFISDHNSTVVEVLVIQFSSEVIEKLNSFDEFSDVNNFILLTQNGLKISGLEDSQIDRTLDILTLEGFDKFIKLLQVLFELSRLEHRPIDRFATERVLPVRMPDRLKRVNKFILDNYNRDISLDEISEIARMNPSAFCRDFKKHTRKTFIEYINDLRIDYACKLLMEGSMSISSICYEVGYNSLTYFNRVFKKKKRTTPNEFRLLNSGLGRYSKKAARYNLGSLKT